MGSGNWVIDNLNSALGMWNDKLAEIWALLSTSPEHFKGGGMMGVVKTCGSLAEMKRPELAVKCLIRFALAQGAFFQRCDLPGQHGV